MDNFEYLIGKNIKEVRNQRGLSQETLAKECGFSNTTLSAYENGRKIPNIVTIAKIAKQLNVSIERLYYGDENNAFIISAPNEGRKIVNCIYFLWKNKVISYFENFSPEFDTYDAKVKPQGLYVYIKKFQSPIKRLINSLNEYELNIDTYPDKNTYLDLILSSVATEINNKINEENSSSEFPF